MAQSQIRIERKTLARKSSSSSKDAAAIDLRTPSGRKLPY